MLVSFVIPTRNQAPFIRRCIDSCLAQRIDDREIIVMDGVSTDGTQDILASYGDAIAWVSEPDEGQSDAINKGINRATGDIIAWVNSDDFYPHENVLPRVVEAFESDDAMDIVYGNGNMVDDEGKPFRTQFSQPLPTLRPIITFAGVFVMQPALFFRRQLFLDVGGVRNDLHLAMDLDLWLRMFPKARRYEYLDETLACATFHRDAKSVQQMLPQIREISHLKARVLDDPAFDMRWLDRLKFLKGKAMLLAYWCAVRMGLRRLA